MKIEKSLKEFKSDLEQAKYFDLNKVKFQSIILRDGSKRIIIRFDDLLYYKDFAYEEFNNFTQFRGLDFENVARFPIYNTDNYVYYKVIYRHNDDKRLEFILYKKNYSDEKFHPLYKFKSNVELEVPKGNLNDLFINNNTNSKSLNFIDILIKNGSIVYLEDFDEIFNILFNSKSSRVI